MQMRRAVLRRLTVSRRQPRVSTGLRVRLTEALARKRLASHGVGVAFLAWAVVAR
ncbi:hypothetical protein BH09GEM1_BH09GEM1_40900 [soil metagenome]